MELSSILAITYGQSWGYRYAIMGEYLEAA